MADVVESSENTKWLLDAELANVDDKNRVLVAKAKRIALGPKFAVAFAPVGCLWAMSSTVWDAAVSLVMSFDPLNEGRQMYARLMLPYSIQGIDFDGAGRFVLPQRFQDLARIKNKVLLHGVGDRIEIWNPEEYDRFMANPDGYNLHRRQPIREAYDQMLASRALLG